MYEPIIDCFGMYKIYRGHDGCRCDVCISREDCIVERDRIREETLKKYGYDPAQCRF